MAKSKHNKSQILEFLKKAQQGENVNKLCKEYGVSSATYYNWRQKYGKELNRPVDPVPPVNRERVPYSVASSTTRLTPLIEETSKIRSRLKELEKEAQKLKIQYAEAAMKMEDMQK